MGLWVVLAACSFDSTGLGGASASDPTATAGSGESTTGSTAESEASTGDPSTGGGSESASSGLTATTGDPTDATTGSTGVDVTTATTGEPTTSPSTTTTSSTTADTEPDTTGCADPLTYYPDADMDGYGAPGMGVVACEPPPGHVLDDSDCNDGVAAAYPDAPELCDGVDNDCDALVDEYGDQNAGDCGECEVLVFAGSVYHFCDDGSHWDGARSRCNKLGGDLVVIGSDAEFVAVWERLKARSGEHWIGASDKGSEGTHRWIDNSPLADNDPRWAPGQPAGLFEDCAAVGAGGGNSEPGRYRMLLCDPIFDRRRVCESPL